MTAVGMLTIGTGLLLVWAGVKDEDPREIITRVLSGRAGTAGDEAPRPAGSPGWRAGTETPPRASGAPGWRAGGN